MREDRPDCRAPGHHRTAGRPLPRGEAPGTHGTGAGARHARRLRTAGCRRRSQDLPPGPDSGRGIRGHPAPVHHVHDGGSAHHPPRARRHVGGAVAGAHRRSRQEHLRIRDLHGARQGRAPYLAGSHRARAGRTGSTPQLMRRELNFLGVALCLGLLGYAWYAQAVLHLEPCPLCIFQRVGVAVVGLLFLLAALHHPRRWGARVYGVLLLLAALATMAVAARHLWIQHLPEGAVPACGATLSYMLEVFPVADVVRKVLTGSGECARITWTMLGLSMPAWVLLAAAGLGALGAYANLFDRRTPALGQDSG